jgi:thiamine biosynthesis lipoprotein
VHVTEDHSAGPGAPGQTIAIRSGGLATSSTTVRRWKHDGAVMHHIIDPDSGAPIEGPWRTATVTAGNCTDANIASTAALVRGESAAAWLEAQRLPARLVGADGRVRATAGWPRQGGREAIAA